MTIRWGIIGPGSIAGNFARGLAESASGTLHAIASRAPERLKSFGDRYGVPVRHATYDALIADPSVDAVHVATPHPFHVSQALAAIRAGKHVSVEKPAGLCEAEVVLLAEAAAQEGVFFMEAVMHVHHPQYARALEILASGELGAVRHIRAVFGFAAPFDPDSRLYSHDLAGGGILDVGGYPASAARLFAGIDRYAEPVSVRATARLGRTGVDEEAHALLTFAGGVSASLSVSVARDLGQLVEVQCETGRLILDDPWIPGKDAGPSDTKIRVEGTDARVETISSPPMLYAYEAEAASKAIAEGRRELAFPAFSPAASIGNARVLDAWRHEAGYAVVGETPATLRRLSGAMPAGLPEIGRVAVGEAELCRLVLGCDNRDWLNDGAVVWDAFMEAGGRSFDTGFVYGGGRHEAVLGQWIAARGVAGEITVIVKGAHTPYCTPRAIGAQLAISLERLGLAHAPVYIMHRDNEDVPVGEFVEAIAALRDRGLIGTWGGSNWSVERFRAAVEYARDRGLEPPRILNNNLSLAVMEKPVWPGCITSNTPETLAFLRKNKVAHLAWSSGARGYFLPAELRDRLPEDTRPETCYGSPANAERRRRAEALAGRRGVSAHNVATAWVLAQDFPSVALIGPRSPGEIASTMGALSVELSPAEVAWLNLEADAV